MEESKIIDMLETYQTRRSTKNYSRITGEAPMGMMNPSVMVSR